MSRADLFMSGFSHYLSPEEIETHEGGDIMGILFIGIGLLVGMRMWIEHTETFHEWADRCEHLRFTRKQEERKLAHERDSFLG